MAELGQAKGTEECGTGIEAPLLWLLFILIGPVGHYLFQRNLNRVLEAQG